MAFLRNELPGTLLWVRSFILLLAVGWSPRTTNTTASLRGIHYVGQGVIWASGASGTILRSEDDGFVWQNCTVPPGGEKLDFRGLWAWDADNAVVMSSGPGDASRVYATKDGGAHWRLLFTNPDPQSFWDSLLFRDARRGVILGDPVNDRFVIWTTEDAGEHWVRDQARGLEALKDEGAFAASNSSLVLVPGTDELVFGTGGPEGARVFQRIWGEWTATKAPLAGIFSMRFRDSQRGVAVGGDYKKPGQRAATAAFTADGGKTWFAAATMPGGYRSTVDWDALNRCWVTAGTNGADISRDDGKTWTPFQSTGWNALSLPWAAGAEGRIAVANASR